MTFFLQFCGSVVQQFYPILYYLFFDLLPRSAVCGQRSFFFLILDSFHCGFVISVLDVPYFSLSDLMNSRASFSVLKVPTQTR
jgi:hypothetical protein